MTSHDYFSAGAAEYATYRPRYPASLFARLAALAPDRLLAWDCATGNGQAAVSLADQFARVIATDMSAAQIQHALPHARVEYRVARAEASALAAASVSLVNVAQALHWLDLDAFYAEVRRVLVPSGVLSVSSYGSAELETPALAAVFTDFELVRLERYWPPGRHGVGDGLRHVPFPFAEVATPESPLQVRWTLAQLLGYARSWSATASYTRQHAGVDPVLELDAELRPLWGPPDTPRTVRWPFFVRAGRVR
ncbi:MAG: class I SAM-dependent methyltransferase [Gemmatimonadaceae bacterium]